MNTHTATDTTAQTFTLADLAAWDKPGTHLAVLGHPIAHSLSPLMHNAALAAMSARAPRYRDWRYHRFDIAPEDLPRALKLFHEKKFHGLNLTVPHKVLAFDALARDNPADIDPAALPIGAVNTLTRTPQGWRATNTDGHGLATAIRETLHLDLAGAHILLLGAGGAARGAAVECLQRRCATLTIANRTQANLDALLAAMRPLADTNGVALSGTGCQPVVLGSTDFQPVGLEVARASSPCGSSVTGDSPVHKHNWTPDSGLRTPAGLGSSATFNQPVGLPLRPALIINATSSGLRPADPPPIDLAAFPPAARPLAVFDMIYNPPQTPLLLQAVALNIPRANGLAMLIHQGARSLEIWTGEKIPVEAMEKVLKT